MGANLLSSRSRFGAALAFATVSGCAHKLPAPPAAPRVVTATATYLLERPTGLTGNTQRVVDGVWCARDRAFSLPVVPFPDGPTEIYGQYYDGGVTSTLKMLDAHESVLEIARTKIRPDLPEQEVLPRVAAKLDGSRDPINDMSIEWIR